MTEEGLGITIQMISDTYVGVYIRFKQLGDVSESAGQAAIAMIFLHGFGYAIGEFVSRQISVGHC